MDYFVGCGEAQVAARVWYQWVRRCAVGQSRDERPAYYIQAAWEALPKPAGGLMKLCYLSMWEACVSQPISSRMWLHGVVMRDRLGLNFRAALFAEYKATRRDPRVTNRGVKR